MRLGDLLAALPVAEVDGPVDREIVSIQTDGRRVGPCDLFVAYRGVALDLHRFVPQAVRNGAIAVVAERPVRVPKSVTRVVVPSGRAAWALLSAAWHGFPSRRLAVVGVTGTDGKTTTASLIDAVLGASGRRVGLVTTVAARIDGRAVDTGLHTTTPDPPDAQAFLAEMVERGTEIAVLETTSHALALEKVLGVDYDVAVVTNVTPEHLDFHGTFEAYLEAKATLFESLARARRKPGVPKTAVLNRDDMSYERLAACPVDRQIDYALERPAAITARALRLGAHKTRFVAVTPLGEIEIESRLLGRFNAANALAAIGAGLAFDVPLEAAARGLGAFHGVPGRLEPIDLGQPFGVVIDFAHTPNSLRRLLELGRSLTKKRLSVVFGCAGERDPGKRPLMGQVAGELADRVYLTAEDPRRESLDAIIAEVAAGVRAAGREPTTVPDRAEAIARAIADAEPGDLVLLTGKGHERSMCFGDEERPWDERAAATDALARLGYRLNPQPV
ncbi:MAG TPA: UDP-N-acetylmuramoyl-L-alanyl-D-glutamate--2,6-diaminopimelate ligase [Chloroflexota bacterium]|nr:UDP-N-acetylmuramoyl-L-alanyl-D-glutamate--2,6-diaminopimelate ligase [Chloroflexota bacterium]